MSHFTPGPEDRRARIRALSVVAYANGASHWHYRAEGQARWAVEAPDFLGPVRKLMVDGDLITIVGRDFAMQRVVRIRDDTITLEALT